MLAFFCVVVLRDQLSDSVVACIVLFGRCKGSLSLLCMMLFCLIITSFEILLCIVSLWWLGGFSLCVEMLFCLIELSQ